MKKSEKISQEPMTFPPLTPDEIEEYGQLFAGMLPDHGWGRRRLTKAQSRRLLRLAVRKHFNDPSRWEACPGEPGALPTAGEGIRQGNRHDMGMKPRRDGQQSSGEMAPAPCPASTVPCPTGNDASQAQVEVHAAQAPRMCAKCKQTPARPNQWTCRQCHSESMHKYRLRYRQEVLRLRESIAQLTIKNFDTLRAFEKKCGKRRHVLVMTKEDGHLVPYRAGTIIEFLPGLRLAILTVSGEVIRTELSMVRRDKDLQ